MTTTVRKSRTIPVRVVRFGGWRRRWVELAVAGGAPIRMTARDTLDINHEVVLTDADEPPGPSR